MITAVIQSIYTQGSNIIVSVLFSNSSNPILYTFGLNDTQDTISIKIQGDLDTMNGLSYSISNYLQPLIGTTFQTNPETLTTLQSSIVASNTPVSVSSIGLAQSI